MTELAKSHCCAATDVDNRALCRAELMVGADEKASSGRPRDGAASSDIPRLWSGGRPCADFEGENRNRQRHWSPMRRMWSARAPTKKNCTDCSAFASIHRPVQTLVWPPLRTNLSRGHQPRGGTGSFLKTPVPCQNKSGSSADRDQRTGHTVRNPPLQFAIYRTRQDLRESVLQ
jgi:hypothetical protein